MTSLTGQTGSDADHERIWLQPKCCAGEFEGRLWCQDNVFDDGECEDGAKATEYVRADLYHELVMAVARKFPGETRHQTALRYIRDRERTETPESSSVRKTPNPHPDHTND